MKGVKARSNGMLMLAALIWGIAFVAQSEGMEFIGPFTFTAARSFIGCIALLPCIFFFDWRRRNTARKEAQGRKVGPEKPSEQGGTGGKTLLLGGVCCGVVLAVSSSLQQFGLLGTSVGKAGFITALYIIIVPILGLFFRRRVSPMVWVSVLLALVGMYLLCMVGSGSLGAGDLLTLACAVCFSVHILVIDHFSDKVDCVRMSCIQFLVCGVVCAVPALLLEGFNGAALLQSWLPLLYTGILSSSVGYTLQMIAQKNTGPVVASLILSLEAVFAALAGWVILQEGLTWWELVGCALMFCAILLAQVPDLRSRQGHQVAPDMDKMEKEPADRKEERVPLA